jgi:hypothetical protein
MWTRAGLPIPPEFDIVDLSKGLNRLEYPIRFDPIFIQSFDIYDEWMQEEHIHLPSPKDVFRAINASNRDTDNVITVPIIATSESPSPQINNPTPPSVDSDATPSSQHSDIIHLPRIPVAAFNTASSTTILLHPQPPFEPTAADVNNTPNAILMTQTNNNTTSSSTSNTSSSSNNNNSSNSSNNNPSSSSAQNPSSTSTATSSSSLLADSNNNDDDDNNNRDNNPEMHAETEPSLNPTTRYPANLDPSIEPHFSISEFKNPETNLLETIPEVITNVIEHDDTDVKKAQTKLAATVSERTTKVNEWISMHDTNDELSDDLMARRADLIALITEDDLQLSIDIQKIINCRARIQ